MLLPFWKRPTLSLNLATFLAFAGAILIGAGARAENEPADVVEGVALADDPPQAEAAEPKAGTIREEVRQWVGPGSEGVEEHVKQHLRGHVGQGDVLFYQNHVGSDDSGKFWIGVECHEAAPELRAQLGLDDRQGLVVVRISNDSAAEKAGLKKHDVVVAAGEKILGRVPDLAKAVDDADGKQLVLKVIRAGKEQTIQITPAERPRDKVKFFARPHAGMFLSTGVRLELPDNMSIRIERQGKQPASIVVTRGDDKWETTEEHLDKLPDDVRPLAERALGGGPWTMPMPGKAMGVFGSVPPPVMQIEALPDGRGHRMQIKTFAPGEGAGDAPPRDHFKAAPVPPLGGTPGDMAPEIMKRLEMMNRRLEQMQDEIRRLKGDRPAPGTFERRVPPPGERGDRRDGERREFSIEIDADRPAPDPERK